MTASMKKARHSAGARQPGARRGVSSMRVAAFLLVAALATACVVGGTLARYTAGDTSSDSARVAIFGHSEFINMETDWTAGLVPGITRTYDLAVTNGDDDRTSEVAQRYSIVLTTSGNLPLTYTLAPADGSAVLGSFTESATTATHTFSSDSMAFAASQQSSHEYKLTVNWPAEKNDASLAGVPDFIQIDIDVEQID